MKIKSFELYRQKLMKDEIRKMFSTIFFFLFFYFLYNLRCFNHLHANKDLSLSLQSVAFLSIFEWTQVQEEQLSLLLKKIKFPFKRWFYNSLRNGGSLALYNDVDSFSKKISLENQICQTFLRKIFFMNESSFTSCWNF